jgi:D-inositol-3-phosphate glycosyltransferase
MSEHPTKKTKIVFLAPFEPFRSGIAKHSTQIAKELATRESIDLTLLSFSRLYPKFLFPGDSDKDADFAEADHNVTFDLDTINPFTWIKCVNKIKHIKPDILIIPAWTFFVAPCMGWIAKRCKQAGITTICIVHNAFDHEQASWKNKLMTYQLGQINKFVCHNNAIKNDILEVFSEASTVLSPHPIFSQYPKANKTLTRRAEVEFLFFGLIRDYKGLDLLLKACSQLKDIDYHLSVVGECWGDISVYQIMAEELGIEIKVEFVAQYVSDAEAAEYFTRADAVVLPYKSMTGTGVIPLAYHYKTPVITTNLSAFHEVIDNEKSGLIAKGVDSVSLTDAMTQFAKCTDQQQMANYTQKLVKLYTWEKFCNVLLQ